MDAYIRDKKLYEILAYAKKYSPFYSFIKTEALSSFPIMDKLKYIDNYDLIKVDEDVIPGQIGKVHIQTTSGSTGTPFAVPQDTLKRNRRIAELKYFGKIVGFNTHEKLIHLRTWNKWQSKTSKQIKTENIIPFDIAEMGENKLRELCSVIYNSKALCVRGYASSFDLLANYVKDHPITLPFLKICIAGSETLHDDTRANVKDNLHCEIISQYANEECGILAQERIPTKEKDNVMYLNHASYYFEFLKMDSDEPAEYGELARIIVTDLHNHAFPIIRYDTGDVGIIGRQNIYDSRQERLFVEWVGKLICSNCKVVWVRIKIETLSQKYLHSLSILTAFARMWRGALWEVHYLLLSVFSLFLMFSLVKILTYKKTDLSRTSFSVKTLVRSDFRYESGYIIMLSV